MNFNMLRWVHEKPHINFNTSRSQKGSTFSIRPNHPWSLDWNKDCCLVIVDRRAEARMDKRSLGFDSDEFEPLDSCCEPERVGCASASNSVGSAESANVQHAEGACLSLREEPRRVWFKPGALGWAHCGGTPEAVVWLKANGEASSAMDASAGVSVEASRLCLSSSSRG